MRSNDFQAELLLRLGEGARALPERFRLRQSRYLMEVQQADGGFAGRRGGSDLYYTHFALSAAEVLGLEERLFWQRASEFLRARSAIARDLVECYALLTSNGLLARRGLGLGREPLGAAEEVLSALRDPRGGFRSTSDSPPAVYHTYIADLCYRLLGRKMPEVENSVAFVKAQKSADGGFLAGPSSGGLALTSPTAAAAVFLTCRGALETLEVWAAARFLISMQDASSGLLAHSAADGADLLSTFTALVSLDRLGAARGLDLGAVARFVRNLALESGGFRAGPSDDATDPEYAWYGLGALSLLSAVAHSERCACGCSP